MKILSFVFLGISLIFLFHYFSGTGVDIEVVWVSLVSLVIAIFFGIRHTLRLGAKNNAKRD